MRLATFRFTSRWANIVLSLLISAATPAECFVLPSNSSPPPFAIFGDRSSPDHYPLRRLLRSKTSSALGAVRLDGQTIRGPITPVGNFVLVRTKDTLTASDGGILLPDQSQERPTEGEVIAAGPGKIHPHTAVRITNPVTAGDSVLYGKFAGTDMNYNDEDMTMIRDDDILLRYKGVQMTLDNVTPVRDYVLVELRKSALETSSGLVVAQTTMSEYEPCEGKVVKVGEGRMCATGELTPSPVEVGDEVKFKDYAGNQVKIQGGEYALVKMVDILCSVPEETSE